MSTNLLATLHLLHIITVLAKLQCIHGHHEALVEYPNWKEQYLDTCYKLLHSVHTIYTMLATVECHVSAGIVCAYSVCIVCMKYSYLMEHCILRL